jgi:cobalt-zinc-cadmium efflux system outer membrane protein
LETTRQLLDSRLRQEQLRAELRRAWADLERSVGRRLDAEPPIEVPRRATGPTGATGPTIPMP